MVLSEPRAVVPSGGGLLAVAEIFSGEKAAPVRAYASVKLKEAGFLKAEKFLRSGHLDIIEGKTSTVTLQLSQKIHKARSAYVKKDDVRKKADNAFYDHGVPVVWVQSKAEMPAKLGLWRSYLGLNAKVQMERVEPYESLNGEVPTLEILSRAKKMPLCALKALKLPSGSSVKLSFSTGLSGEYKGEKKKDVGSEIFQGTHRGEAAIGLEAGVTWKVKIRKTLNKNQVVLEVSRSFKGSFLAQLKWSFLNLLQKNVFIKTSTYVVAAAQYILSKLGFKSLSSLLEHYFSAYGEYTSKRERGTKRVEQFLIDLSDAKAAAAYNGFMKNLDMKPLLAMRGKSKAVATKSSNTGNSNTVASKTIKIGPVYLLKNLEQRKVEKGKVRSGPTSEPQTVYRLSKTRQFGYLFSNVQSVLECVLIKEEGKLKDAYINFKFKSKEEGNSRVRARRFFRLKRALGLHKASDKKLRDCCRDQENIVVSYDIFLKMGAFAKIEASSYQDALNAFVASGFKFKRGLKQIPYILFSSVEKQYVLDKQHQRYLDVEKYRIFMNRNFIYRHIFSDELVKLTEKYQQKCGRSLKRDVAFLKRATDFADTIAECKNAAHTEEMGRFVEKLFLGQKSGEETVAALSALVGRDEVILHKFSLKTPSLRISHKSEGELKPPDKKALTLNPVLAGL